MKSMSLEADLLGAFECNAPDEIRAALAGGISPTEPIKGKTPMVHLIEMYLRSPKFADCVRAMLEAGAVIEDPVLQAVLLDDVAPLKRLMKAPGFRIERRFDMECTFTPLKGATALHICAEYNSVRCAAALIKAGANVNAKAAVDSTQPTVKIASSFFLAARMSAYAPKLGMVSITIA